jgi:predicted dehydrogenase
MRIAFLGAGGNTRAKHLPGFAAIPGVVLAGVANRSRASGEAVAREFGLRRVYAHWREAVEDPEVDAVCIGTWPYLHAEMSCAALAAGKHVLCEARMAMDLAEARRMQAAAASSGRVAQLVPSPFTLGVDAEVQDRIASGWMGRLLAIDLVHHGRAFVDPVAPLTWRQDRAMSGENVLAMGIWYEALLRWVGCARRVSSLARITVPQRRNLAGDLVAVSVPDHLEVLAEMACGATAHLRFSSVTGLGAPSGIWLHGSEGTLHFDAGSAELRGARRGDADLAPIAIPAERRGVWQVEADFVASVREGRPVTRTSFADGVAYMAFTQAVAEAGRNGAWVAVAA